MRTLELQGTFRAMGAAFGEACRDEIRSLYALRINNAIEQAMSYGGRRTDERKLLTVAEQCLPIVQAYHPSGYEELEGVAAGAGLCLAQIWAMNALTDLRDLAAFSDLASADAEGCSSIVVGADVASDGVGLCGQTWDLSTDNMPFVLMVRRRPTTGPETLCLTTVGCLSLIGMNAHGVAVGTTNIRASDVRLGVGYLDVIHRALTAKSASEARTAISEAPRAAAHYFYVIDATGDAWAIECTAKAHESVDASQGVYVHCNHFLQAPLLDLEVRGTPMASSHHRQARLTELAKSAAHPLSESALMRSFEDTSGGDNAICRHDFNGISSNGAVVMAPSRRALWVVHGPPDSGRWTSMSLTATPAG